MNHDPATVTHDCAASRPRGGGAENRGAATILVVDDCPDILQLLAASLQVLGYNVLAPHVAQRP